jgi:DNA polymerase V
VIAAVSGHLTVKRLAWEEGRLILLPDRLGPAGPGYEPIEVSSSEELVIWGVVCHVIHEVS